MQASYDRLRSSLPLHNDRLRRNTRNTTNSSLPPAPQEHSPIRSKSRKVLARAKRCFLPRTVQFASCEEVFLKEPEDTARDSASTTSNRSGCAFDVKEKSPAATSKASHVGFLSVVSVVVLSDTSDRSPHSDVQFVSGASLRDLLRDGSSASLYDDLNPRVERVASFHTWPSDNCGETQHRQRTF